MEHETSKRYDDQLKLQAIEMALEGSKSVAQIARDLDIKDNTLYGWVDKHRRDNPDKASTKLVVAIPVDLEAQNRKLKRELARALEDVELLKRRRRTLRFTSSKVRLDRRT
nr:transposase [Thiomicrorhabdus aquaedulcis]